MPGAPPGHHAAPVLRPATTLLLHLALTLLLLLLPMLRPLLLLLLLLLLHRLGRAGEAGKEAGQAALRPGMLCLPLLAAWLLPGNPPGHGRAGVRGV